ncbi:MAG TPA: hypothetical protein VNZ58_15265 [Thermomicrobiales bacterium]|nr:hypothetical protein [Thermomicrobiales bacterium]
MWDTLTSVPDSGDVLNAFAVLSLVVFGAIFLAAGVFSARPKTPPLGELYSRRFIKQSTAILGWASGIGLFFLLIRLLQIDPISFGRPIWIAFSWILLIASMAYVGFTSIADKETRRKNRAAGAPTTPRRPARKRR